MSAQPSQPPAPDRRVTVVFGSLVALYAATVLGLAVTGHFGFIWKTVVLPALLLVALLSGRFKSFVRDWGPFLGAVLLFDSLRGWVFATITRFDLAYYAGYVIRAERGLLGGRTLPTILQEALLGAEPGPLEKALVVVHSSHFLVFLLFGLFLWLVRPVEFRRFQAGLLLVIGAGLLFYLAVPTVPPWMAYQEFALLPPIRHVANEIYNLNVPSLRAAFDVNPIAAMPSLHTALPTYLSLIALHHFGRRGLVMLVYAALVMLSITYLGEHYLLDVAAGALLAIAGYFVTHRLPAATGWLEPELPSVVSNRALRVPVLLTLLLLVGTEAVGVWTMEWRESLAVTPAFIARELEGKSPMKSYYAGSIALERGDTRSAERELARAAYEVPRRELRRAAAINWARAAFKNGRPGVTLTALGRVPERELPPDALGLKARALQGMARYEEATQTLDHLHQRARRDPESAYQLALVGHDLHRLSPDALRATASSLEPLAEHSELWAARVLELRKLSE